MKYLSLVQKYQLGVVAPFAGAWIEIINTKEYKNGQYVAPFAGAWIEIFNAKFDEIQMAVAPFAGAWIEIYH